MRRNISDCIVLASLSGCASGFDEDGESYIVTVVKFAIVQVVTLGILIKVIHL